jgi:hypothetical protein
VHFWVGCFPRPNSFGAKGVGPDGIIYTHGSATSRMNMGERSPMDPALRQARVMHVVFTLTPLFFVYVLLVSSFYFGRLLTLVTRYSSRSR